MSTREYAKNLFSAWSDEDFCNQPIFDKLFFTVLNGQRAVNAAGIQPINFTRWRKSMRDGERLPSIDELKAALLRMERRGYVFTDEDTGEVLIRSRIRNDGLDKQPTMFLAALRLLAVVDSAKFAAVMAVEIDRMDAPETKGDTDYAKNLRAAIARAGVEARAHLKRQADRVPNPLAEPFEGESLGESPGPSRRPSQGGSRRPGEMAAAEGGSPGGSTGPLVSGSVSGSLQPVDGDLGGSRAPTHARTREAEPHPPDDDTEPPTRCKKHRALPPDTVVEEDCGPCANFGKAHDRWSDRQTAELANAARQARAQRVDADLESLEAWRAQITQCDQCDDEGRRAGGVIVCDHTPGQAETNARGIAAVRAALAHTGTDHA